MRHQVQPTNLPHISCNSSGGGGGGGHDHVSSAIKSPPDDPLQEMHQMGLNDGIQNCSNLMQEENKLLPQEFKVKYLGMKEASGLWGIKHTRKPVDEMVGDAKQLSKGGEPLPELSLRVSGEGVTIGQTPPDLREHLNDGLFPIENISYGVQDLVYTRVFAMIIVKKEAKSNPLVHPFHCYAFVCETRNCARKLTFALAEAFHLFSMKVKNNKLLKPKKFAIDLRSAEEMEADLKDSEA